jgi:spore photoproduct lyase
MVPSTHIAYISLGTVRFQPEMRRTITTRFPQSRVTLGELLPDVDGKVRMLSPMRINLYREVAAEVRRHAPEVFIYLCMEPSWIWQRALGLHFNHREEVEFAIAQSLYQRFRLGPGAPEASMYPPY